MRRCAVSAILVTAVCAAAGAEITPEARLVEIVTQLTSADRNEWLAARTLLREHGDDILVPLITLRDNASAKHTRDAANKAIRQVLAGWTLLFANAEQMMLPRNEGRRAFVARQLPFLPGDVQALFWRDLRERGDSQGGGAVMLELDVRARLGLEPLRHEAHLHLNADGSGTYEQHSNAKQLLKALVMMAHEEEPDKWPEHIEELAGEMKEELTSPAAKDLEGLKGIEWLPLKEERPVGDWGVRLKFADMASLAGALERCGTDVFKPTFSLTRESDRGFLLERERPWPTELGMLGLELPWIVGAREKITFTSDLFIRRTTGRKIGPHECVWEGMLSDLMLNWQCAVELAADEKPNGAPAQQANTDVDFRAPKGTERLFSDQVEIRREALWNLPPRSPEVARALLRAFEREEDLKAQLLLREILGTTISTKLRPHYWELDRWRELVKQNCDDPHLWPETSTPATEKAPADVQR